MWQHGYSIPRWHPPWRVEVASKLRDFNNVYWWEELDWASQLQLSGKTNLHFRYVKTWVNADYARLGRLSLVKSHPSRCIVASAILPMRQFMTTPEVVEEEGSYASRFTVVFFFLKTLQELSYNSLGLARFNWHSLAQLPALRFFLWLSLTRRHKSLAQKYFHSILLLSLILVLYLLHYSVKRSIYGERN